MRQCPHTDLVGLSLVSRLVGTAPCAPGTLLSICQMREPEPAIPATVNGMGTLRALPFPGNSSIFKSILITQPHTWVFSFYLKAHASIRSLGNKMLFQEPKVPSVSKARKIEVSEGTAGPMAPGFGCWDPNFLSVMLHTCSKLWSAWRWHSQPAWCFLHATQVHLWFLFSFQEARQGY